MGDPLVDALNANAEKVRLERAAEDARLREDQKRLSDRKAFLEAFDSRVGHDAMNALSGRLQRGKCNVQGPDRTASDNGIESVLYFRQQHEKDGHQVKLSLHAGDAGTFTIRVLPGPAQRMVPMAAFEEDRAKEDREAAEWLDAQLGAAALKLISG